MVEGAELFESDAIFEADVEFMELDEPVVEGKELDKPLDGDAV